MFESVSKLRVGDPVLWRGRFGHGDSKRAVITSIEVDLDGRNGYVDEILWSEVKGCSVIVSLDNGLWAYGFQITPYI